MDQLHENQDRLSIRISPWPKRLMLISSMVAGLCGLYLFTVSSRIECQRYNDSGGSCEITKKAGLRVVAEESFALSDFKEVQIVKVGRRERVGVDVVLSSSRLRFSERSMERPEAEQLSSAINDFVANRDQRSLQEEQEPRNALLIAGLLFLFLGIAPLPFIWRSKVVRLDP